MRRTVEITAQQIMPTVEKILLAQGVPETASPNDKTLGLASDAIDAYRDLARPIGLVMDVTPDEFQRIFVGEGKNDRRAPLGDIYSSSDHLNLFAVTIGDDICREISRLFDSNDYAYASMLDSAASEGTELASDYLEKQARRQLEDQRLLDLSQTSMQFSPGYCGWHISAQKKLFEYLQPEEIGIELTDSFLMHPLKSISGIIAVAKKNLFRFEDNLDFCRECRTRSCRQRIVLLDDE